MGIFDIFASKDKKLLRACEKGNLKKVKKLIKSGANVNIKDKDARSPLHCVNNFEIAKL